jgi:hypothetical protein
MRFKRSIWDLQILPHGSNKKYLISHPFFLGTLINCSPLCAGGLEYLHLSPASRRRRRKGRPVPEGITGPPCHWGYKYRGLVLQVVGWTQGWRPRSDKEIIVAKSKWKSDSIWQNLLRKTMTQKGMFCRWWWWWWWWWINDRKDVTVCFLQCTNFYSSVKRLMCPLTLYGVYEVH